MRPAECRLGDGAARRGRAVPVQGADAAADATAESQPPLRCRSIEALSLPVASGHYYFWVSPSSFENFEREQLLLEVHERL